MKYLFHILENCVVFIAQISHYGKFTALHKNNFDFFANDESNQVYKNFPRNHAVPWLFS